MFFFFNDTATTEIYTLSLHDALPISNSRAQTRRRVRRRELRARSGGRGQTRRARPARGRALRAATDAPRPVAPRDHRADRKSTRLNSSHANISYAVFCLKKKTRSSHS